VDRLEENVDLSRFLGDDHGIPVFLKRGDVKRKLIPLKIVDKSKKWLLNFPR
jgi:hypothetical protein